MGLPLPTGTLYRLPHSMWPDDNDWSKLSDEQRMDRQWKAYRGLFKSPLRRQDPSEPDHNVIDNRCEPIVATGVDFLLGDEVTFEVMDTIQDEHGEPLDVKDERAQEYLDAVLEANTKMPLLAEEEINKAVFGHGFLKLDPDDPDTAPYPAISILNPQQMSVVTSPYDVRKVTRYAFTYQDVNDQGDEVIRREVWERASGGSQGWTIREQEQVQASPLITTGMTPTQRAMLLPDTGWRDFEAPQPWKYPWSPVHDGKNLPEPNSYWGKPDLRLDLIHLNDVLNFLLSNRQRILYYHAHPKDIFFGVHSREIDVTPGGSICIVNPQARVEHIEMAGDLAALTAAIQDIRESMDELSHVPALALGHTANLPGVTSGVAMDVACRPLVAQTKQKRNLRTALYTKLCQHILELAGFGADRKILIHWAEMLPRDDLQDAQTAVTDLQLGVSKDTLQQKRGYKPDVERQKKLEEAEDDAEAMQQQQEMLAASGFAPVAQPPVGAPGQSTGQVNGGENSPSQQASQAPSHAARGPTGATRGRQGQKTQTPQKRTSKSQRSAS